MSDGGTLSQSAMGGGEAGDLASMLSMVVGISKRTGGGQVSSGGLSTDVLGKLTALEGKLVALGAQLAPAVKDVQDKVDTLNITSLEMQGKLTAHDGTISSLLSINNNLSQELNQMRNRLAAAPLFGVTLGLMVHLRRLFMLVTNDAPEGTYTFISTLPTTDIAQETPHTVADYNKSNVFSLVLVLYMLENLLTNLSSDRSILDQTSEFTLAHGLNKVALDLETAKSTEFHNFVLDICSGVWNNEAIGTSRVAFADKTTVLFNMLVELSGGSDVTLYPAPGITFLNSTFVEGIANRFLSPIGAALFRWFKGGANNSAQEVREMIGNDVKTSVDAMLDVLIAEEPFNPYPVKAIRGASSALLAQVNARWPQDVGAPMWSRTSIPRTSPDDLNAWTYPMDVYPLYNLVNILIALGTMMTL